MSRIDAAPRRRKLLLEFTAKFADRTKQAVPNTIVFRRPARIDAQLALESDGQADIHEFEDLDVRPRVALEPVENFEEAFATGSLVKER